MRYIVVFELGGALAGAAAVEWTETAAPLGDAGWQPCQRLRGGRWRLATAAGGAHSREPGLFSNVGLRYRLSATGPWSPISASRKEIVIVAVREEDLRDPPAAKATDWRALPSQDMGGGRIASALVLSGIPAAAVAVQWTPVDVPAPDDWRSCVALGEGAWALDGAGDPDQPVGIRYRLAPEAAWSPVSEDRKAPALPAALTAPTLSGTGRIAAALTVQPGLWSGSPAFAFQWRRDGADIAGATAAVYVPGPEDDLCALTCRVVALTAAGSVTVETAALGVTYVAPAAKGELFDEVFDQGVGWQTVAAAGDFAGEALRFAVAGAGATVDAGTGVVSIPTDAAVAGAEVTVTATNSGGAAASRFLVTVEAVDGEVELPLPPRLDQMAVTTAWDPNEAAGTFRIDVAFSGTPGPVEAVEWTSVSPANARFGEDATFEPAVAKAGVWRGSSRDAAGRLHLRSAPPSHWRYRWRIGGEWSLASENVASRVAAPAKPRGEAARWKAVPTRTPEEEAAGIFGGDIAQAYFSAAVSPAAPNRVIAGQDMGQMGRTANFGDRWEDCPAKGYRVQSTQSCAVDPENPDMVLFSSSCYFEYGLRQLEGIYRSTDGGTSFTLVQPIPFMAHVQTYPMYHFATDPTTRGASRVWYYCWRGTEQGSKTAFLDGQIWKSTDNGLTWKIVTANALTVSRFGRLDSLIHHPTRSGELYLACEKGLFRNSAGGAGGPTSWTTVGNLPAGKRVRTLCIDPRDNRLMWCSVDGMGLYRSTDGGTTWTLRLAPWWTLASGVNHETNSMRVAVGADGTAVWAIGGAHTQGKVSLDGGMNWQTVTVTGRLGDPFPFTTKLMGQWGHVVPHPTEPRTALAASWGEWWKTKNGKDWVSSQSGLLGVCVTWSPSCWWFDKDDWRRMAVGPADLGFITTDNAWGHVEYNNIPQTLTGEVIGAYDAATGQNNNDRMRSAGGVLRWPAGHARRNWAMAAAGASWDKAVYKSTDAGRNWQPGGIAITINGQTVEAVGKFYFLDQSWQDPNVIYAGRYKTTNGGANWTALSGIYSVVAVSRQDHDVLYAYSKGANSDGISILRSDDGGKAWRAYYANAAGNRSDSRPVVCIDPQDHNILYAIDRKNFDIVRVPGAGAPAEDIGVRGLYAGAIGFSVTMIAVDHRDRDLLYVITNQHGLAHVLRSRDRGVSWQDITGNKYGVAGGSLAVHPLTGDVFSGGPRGSFCFPPPEGYHAAHGIDPARTVWGSLWT